MHEKRVTTIRANALVLGVNMKVFCSMHGGVFPTTLVDVGLLNLQP